MTPAVTRAVKRTALVMREMKSHGKEGAVRSLREASGGSELREASGGSAGSTFSAARGGSVLVLDARKECEERD
eukprot:2212695-Pleurochrysis_carterae.AAC.1